MLQQAGFIARGALTRDCGFYVLVQTLGNGSKNLFHGQTTTGTQGWTIFSEAEMPELLA